MTSARTSLLYTAGIILIVIARSISKETCEKVDTCSCKFKNGSKVNLKPEDGGSSPKFTNIPEADNRKFDWNPCTPFTKSKKCKDVLSCQVLSDTMQYPAGTKDTTFTMDGEGNVVITYGKSTDASDNTRQTQITLKCDPNQNGSIPGGFKGKIVPSYTGPMSSTGEVSVTHTLYTGTFVSKYCCAIGGSGGLSTGSILLIIFFPLLLTYFIIGILVNRFGRGIESIPEVIPNYSFWADVPFLVKDGAVFTFGRVRTACAGKCGKSGYAEI